MLLNLTYNLIPTEIKRLHRIFRPYFGISGENLKRTLAAFSAIVCSISAAISMVYIQNGFSAFNLIILHPEVTYASVAGGLFGCLTPIIVFAGIYSLNSFLVSWLGQNLAYNKSTSNVEKWIDTEFYNGIKFIDKKGESVKAAEIFSNDLNEIANQSTFLASSLMQSIIDFCVGAYQLYFLSAPLVVSLGSLTIALPGYMVLAAVGYAVGYSLLITALDKNLKKQQTKLRHKNEHLTAHLHHVEEYSESIALKKGGPKERNAFLKKINKIYKLESAKRFTNALINFVQNIGNQLSYTLALALTVPGIVSKNFEANNAFSVAYYFTRIVGLFTWKKDNTASMSSLDVALNRFESFETLMQEWNSVRAQHAKDVCFSQSEDRLGVEKLSIFTPSGNPILNNIKIDLPLGKATIIQGPSGVGKTTFLRALSGVWPFMAGKIIFPATAETKEFNAYCIPQQPYFPYRSTLLEAINDANNKPLTAQDRVNVETLMRKLNFKEERIQDLDKKAHWKTELSGGEKQRIAIIGAILLSPDILFMDEATNALDPKNRKLTVELLKEHLKNTTIVAVEHEAPRITNFFDYKLKINDSAKRENQTKKLTLSRISKK